MTKIEFETHLRMVKALIKTGNIKALEEVIDATLKGLSGKKNDKEQKEQHDDDEE